MRMLQMSSAQRSYSGGATRAMRNNNRAKGRNVARGRPQGQNQGDHKVTSEQQTMSGCGRGRGCTVENLSEYVAGTPHISH